MYLLAYDDCLIVEVLRQFFDNVVIYYWEEPVHHYLYEIYKQIIDRILLEVKVLQKRSDSVTD